MNATRNTRARFARLGLMTVALAALGLAAAADGPPAHPDSHAPTAGISDSPERNYFSDVVLTDHLGRQHRFYSDLLEGKTVIINAFFTSCTGVCPVMAGKLLTVQDWLGERLGDDVLILSISVDPETDTQEKLAAYARRVGAKPGWLMLGGSKENVEWALYRVGQYVENKEAHTNVLIVGNERAKVWTKAFGLAPAPDLIKVVEDVLEESG